MGSWWGRIPICTTYVVLVEFELGLWSVGQEYVRVNQVDLDDPEIAPEIQGLWRLLEAQTETSRVYEAAEGTMKDVEPTRFETCDGVT